MHPSIECAADLTEALKGVASVEPTFMSVPEKRAALVALTEARSQLDALTLRVLAESDDLATAHGMRDAAAWLAVETRTTSRSARRDLSLARALVRHRAGGDGLASGALPGPRAASPRMASPSTTCSMAWWGRSPRDAEARLLPPACGAVEATPSTRLTGRTRRGRLPANVIELRPRRA